MTPEEFAAKLEELRAVFADKLVELEENPKWASEDEREEMVKALDELSDQIEDLMEALQTDERQPALLKELFRAWRAQPSLMYEAAPTMVFAVIGQARADGVLSPEAEGNTFSEMLKYWALRDTLDTAVYCAKPALVRSTAPSLLFDTN